MPAVQPRVSALRERLLIQTRTPPTLSVSSITRSDTTATVTTASAHGYATNDYITHAGATLAAYNVTAKITVTGTTTYTFTIAGSPATPATGTITTVYTSDAQGGMKWTWRTLDTVHAELMPIRASERLQMAAIQAVVDYRFRIRVRADLSPKMRLLWTPSAPAGVSRHVLEIAGVLPFDDGRTWQILEASEVAS